MRTRARIVHQLREGVGKTARPHVVDREDRIVRAHFGAAVNHFLRATLDFGVAALHRIEVQISRIRPRRH